jgi:hypothetical protein
LLKSTGFESYEEALTHL